VETDSWLAHSTSYAFQADRSQTNTLQLAGWLVLRFTWADLTRRSRATAAAVSRALTR
jgi:very-short-patch-repair endonuclease